MDGQSSGTPAPATIGRYDAVPPCDAPDPRTRIFSWYPQDQRFLIITWSGWLCLALIVWLALGGPWGGVVNLERQRPLDLQYRIDLNQADWPELGLVPGIGEVLARRVVADRSQHGPYRCLQELSRVPGMGPKKLEAAKKWLSVNLAAEE